MFPPPDHTGYKTKQHGPLFLCPSDNHLLFQGDTFRELPNDWLHSGDHDWRPRGRCRFFDMGKNYGSKRALGSGEHSAGTLILQAAAGRLRI